MASESKTDSKELLKEALLESKKREQLLMQRLTTKERELCQCLQLEQLRAQSASTASTQLKAMMLDPAVNVLYQRLRKELGTTQNDLSAWKFTPDSQTGKRLMARIRQLHQENSELSQGMSSAAVAKMESEIALEKTLLVEMRKTH
uniref:Pre-mRNA-splicing regulator WTAP n=1 Tax=Macrostomum lignano TaxID=282301 RepID=A0A1I8ID76_9PLAT